MPVCVCAVRHVDTIVGAVKSLGADEGPGVEHVGAMLAQLLDQQSTRSDQESKCHKIPNPGRLTLG